MLLLGIGQAEVKGIKGEHFDLKRRVVHIRRKKTGRSYEVPLPARPRVVEMLQREGRLQSGKAVLPWQDLRTHWSALART